jgi:putative (di)nucleoside polyphosphate hydrolase
MASKHEKSQYRPCVGIMLLNSRNEVWVGRRADVAQPEGHPHWWQMPQGGIDEAEDPARAALRELREETGVRSARIIAESSQWHYYDLPSHLIGVAWGGRWRGQKQRWFAVRFLGEDSEIDISGHGHKPEFDAWRWAPIDGLIDLIVPFKRDVYEKVVAEFRHLTV